MQAFAALPAPPDDEAAVHAALLKIAAAQLLFVPPAITVHVLRIELSNTSLIHLNFILVTASVLVAVGLFTQQHLVLIQSLLRKKLLQHLSIQKM